MEPTEGNLRRSRCSAQVRACAGTHPVSASQSWNYLPTIQLGASASQHRPRGLLRRATTAPRAANRIRPRRKVIGEGENRAAALRPHAGCVFNGRGHPLPGTTVGRAALSRTERRSSRPGYPAQAYGAWTSRFHPCRRHRQGCRRLHAQATEQEALRHLRFRAKASSVVAVYRQEAERMGPRSSERPHRPVSDGTTHRCDTALHHRAYTPGAHRTMHDSNNDFSLPDGL